MIFDFAIKSIVRTQETICCIVSFADFRSSFVLLLPLNFRSNWFHSIEFQAFFDQFNTIGDLFFCRQTFPFSAFTEFTCSNCLCIWNSMSRILRTMTTKIQTRPQPFTNLLQCTLGTSFEFPSFVIINQMSNIGLPISNTVPWLPFNYVVCRVYRASFLLLVESILKSVLQSILFGLSFLDACRWMTC